jgi:hypothetical protein
VSSFLQHQPWLAANFLGGASTGTSPRPLSKVRTNFVAVERNGQLALRRDTSGEPSTSKRRSSFSIDDENPRDSSETRRLSRPDVGSRTRSHLAEETIMESPIDKAQATETKMDTSNGTVKKPDTAKATPSKVEEKPAVTNGSSKSTASKPVEKPAGKVPNKPSSISTANTSAGPKTSPKKSLKSPAVPKTPTTPVKNTTKDPQPKVQGHKPAKTSTIANHTSKPESKPSTTAAHGSMPKTRIQESPPQTGFKKPRPKSPTRPVKLPASLTAHTASSGSKTNASPPAAARQSFSRASVHTQATNSLQAHHAASRSPSRASVATTQSALGRKPSTLKQNSSRPSLGPPPPTIKKQPSRTSLPHQPAPADGSFLARMMRPTTASASKTAEKPATNPPPKRAPSVRRPVTKDGPSKPQDVNKGSPARKAQGHVPTKIATKVAKPIEKALKTPTSTSAPAASETPKLESKPVKKAPSQTEKKDEPIVEKESVEEKPTEVMSDVASEPVEKIENSQSEVTEDAPQVGEQQPAAIAETKPEPSVPEAVQEKAELEEPNAEVNASPEVTEQSNITPSMAEPEVAEVSKVKEEPEVVAENEETALDTHTGSEKNETNSSEVDDAPIAEDLTRDHAVKISSPTVASVEKRSTEAVEDPEDAKARAEVERLNAEFAKLAVEPEMTTS